MKPIDTSYAVITVAVYSDKNPVFDEGDHKVQPGLPKTKAWGELSQYFRSKAGVLGLTDSAAWDAARRGGLALSADPAKKAAGNAVLLGLLAGSRPDGPRKAPRSFWRRLGASPGTTRCGSCKRPD